MQHKYKIGIELKDKRNHQPYNSFANCIIIGYTYFKSMNNKRLPAYKISGPNNKTFWQSTAPRRYIDRVKYPIGIKHETKI